MRIFLLFVFGICLSATPSVSAAPQADVLQLPSCRYCGMDRGKFAHSRMLVEYDDGSSVGICSIHCLVVEQVNNIDKTPTSIKVGDYDSRMLIDAEAAFWVIGGERPGVMSNRGKWAFEKKADAEAFIAASKGVLGSFEDAIRSAYDDMYKDTRSIRERRKMKRMKQMEHG
ncbi:MAG: nitrous oxide reductase accessory protein NosL [Deltaproteobacteria bacterium]|nr:nitrous oxide reductase accessory protein NosL [Deltaproteobacteria bacterium]